MPFNWQRKNACARNYSSQNLNLFRKSSNAVGNSQPVAGDMSAVSAETCSTERNTPDACVRAVEYFWQRGGWFAKKVVQWNQR